MIRIAYVNVPVPYELERCEMLVSDAHELVSGQLEPALGLEFVKPVSLYILSIDL